MYRCSWWQFRQFDHFGGVKSRTCDFQLSVFVSLCVADETRFIANLHPTACPSYSAHSALSAVYGMLPSSALLPWVEAMGCCVEPWEWVCAECGHQW